MEFIRFAPAAFPGDIMFGSEIRKGREGGEMIEIRYILVMFMIEGPAKKMERKPEFVRVMYIKKMNGKKVKI